MVRIINSPSRLSLSAYCISYFSVHACSALANCRPIDGEAGDLLAYQGFMIIMTLLASTTFGTRVRTCWHCPVSGEAEQPSCMISMLQRLRPCCACSQRCGPRYVPRVMRAKESTISSYKTFWKCTTTVHCPTKGNGWKLQN